ncbi:MAG: type II secretion system F family protein [Bryobacteraceae bacterium]|nr:type II secretion system F family protein [Bryobacteraceae bacterium]MCX7603918.1 type II secretion system F family protein [Bryobacteraceae bacterium]
MPLPEFLLLFAIALAAASAAGYAFWHLAGRDRGEPPPELPPLPPAGRWSARLLETLLQLGVLASPSGAEDASLRARLAAAGFRHPAAPAVFQGARLAAALLLAACLAWAAAARGSGAAGAAAAVACGLGLGVLLPQWMLGALIQSRIQRIHAGLPSALDLMVLSLEAGQGLDVALAETSRELRGIFPELASEFWQVQLEIRAGRPRADVLADLGRRTGSSELRKLATVLIDGDRFGTSLAPALRTHARYLRTRRRQTAQEAARKLTVKLIFPVFFLIMPAVLVVTLGPAALAFYEALSGMLAP